MYFFYYIPVGLDIRAGRRAAITYFLSAVFVILFFIYRYRPVGPWWNLFNLTFQPLSPNIFQALTHGFLHGGYFHLAGNLVYLVIFGRGLESRYGPVRFLAVCLGSAVAGAYAHTVLTGLLAPEYLGYGVIGASGMTSGLLGLFMVRFYYSRITLAYWVFLPLQGINRAGRSHLPVICAVLLWALLQCVQAVLQFGIAGVRVAYSVHVGGFAVGILLALILGAPAAARLERHLVKARRYFERADWFASQGEYINYLAGAPSDAEVHAEAARVFMCTLEAWRASFHYREAVKLLVGNGERGRAEKIFVEAVRVVPSFSLPAKLHLDVACGMERALKFNSALDAYRRFLECYPASPEAPFVLLRMAGILERRQSRPAEALGCYQGLVVGYPADSWVDFARSQIDRLGRTNPELSQAAD